ncbi:hypothetical protein WR25_23970 [Diploscapter pachys]|uniref:Uncharacterized protein n=1 Tax=Diploscapter pachys TaxID=2018661 RepID=A0A2A2M1V1_9BILA|nr:hypothetical protein WR25_23970 [Diploscapter pachys]
MHAGDIVPIRQRHGELVIGAGHDPRLLDPDIAAHFDGEAKCSERPYTRIVNSAHGAAIEIDLGKRPHLYLPDRPGSVAQQIEAGLVARDDEAVSLDRFDRGGRDDRAVMVRTLIVGNDRQPRTDRDDVAIEGVGVLTGLGRDGCGEQAGGRTFRSAAEGDVQLDAGERASDGLAEQRPLGGGLCGLRLDQRPGGDVAAPISRLDRGHGLRLGKAVDRRQRPPSVERPHHGQRIVHLAPGIAHRFLIGKGGAALLGSTERQLALQPPTRKYRDRQRRTDAGGTRIPTEIGQVQHVDAEEAGEVEAGNVRSASGEIAGDAGRGGGQRRHGGPIGRVERWHIRVAADQHRQGAGAARDIGVERQQRILSRPPLPIRRADVDAGGEAPRLECGGDREHPVAQRLLAERKPALLHQPAPLPIGLRDRRLDRQPRATGGGVRLRGPGGRGLHLAPGFAPQVDRPAGAGIGLVEVERIALGNRSVGGIRRLAQQRRQDAGQPGGADAVATIIELCANLRQAVGMLGVAGDPRPDQPLLGDAQVEIGGARLILQPVEQRVAEATPPGRIGLGRCCDGPLPPRGQPLSSSSATKPAPTVRRSIMRGFLGSILAAEEQKVEGGQRDQGQDGRADQSADHHDRHRPPEDVEAQGDEGEHGGQGGQHHGARAADRCLDHRGTHRHPLGPVHLHLIDQDDGVAHDHPGQRDQPQQRDEAERRARQQQRRHRADDPQRRGGQHQQGSRQALQLDHQQHEHDPDRDRKQAIDRAVGVGRQFAVATLRDVISGRQRSADGGDARSGGVDDLGGLDVADHVGLYRDGLRGIARPDDRLFGGRRQCRDLAQRHHAVRCRYGHVDQTAQVVPILGPTAHHDADPLRPTQHRAARRARQGGGKIARHLRPVHPQRRRTRRIDPEARDRCGDAPVDLNRRGRWDGAQHRRDTLSDRAQAGGIGPGHPVLDRRSQARPQRQATHMQAGARDARHPLQLLDQRIARRQIAGHQHHRRIRRIGQGRTIGKVEARRPATDEAVHGADARVTAQQGLQPPGRRCGRVDRAARPHREVDHHLGPVGIGKELLPHACRAEQADRQQRDRDAGDQPTPVQRPLDRGAQSPVESGRPGGMAMPPRHVRQQLDAQERGEDHGDDPADQQRRSRHPKDAARIFTGRRLSETDRQEPHDRNQRAGQHRKGGVRPGIGCGLMPIDALLHLDHHRFDADDRVVDQEAEREDQRAERNPL